MARTLNPQAHALRRDAFVEVAQRLIASKGYGALSVQDVIDEVGASKGAFYHYFDSKQALMGAVIEWMVEAATAAMRPVADDPDLPAVQKFDRLFATLVGWKGERADLVFGVLDAWLSDENAIVRERMRAGVAVAMTPLLEGIVRQGMVEGSLAATSAEGTALVLVALLLGANETATRLYVGYRAGTVRYDDVECWLLAFREAMERILGLPTGSLTFIDEETLRYWFNFDGGHQERQ